MSNPFTTILNQIIKELVPKVNGEIGSAFRSHGLDPLKNVISGSKGFGIGTAHYSVTNLTGLASLQVQDMAVSNVTNSGENLSGNIATHVHLTSDLSANIEGDVSILFGDPSISGKVTIHGATVSGSGTFKATNKNAQVCLSQVALTSADFNYSGAEAHIDGPGILDDILQPLENLILDGVKDDIRSLVSSQIKGILGSEINKYLPVCLGV